MKKLYALFALLIVFGTNSFAQGIELTPMAGYMWGGSTAVYDGEVKIEDGVNFGLAINTPVRPGVSAELSYFRLDSRLDYRRRRNGVPDTTLFDMSTNYFQIGGVREADYGDLRPFGVFTLGATLFSPKTDDIADNWSFSITLGGGLKYMITDKIGIRVEGRFLFPLFLNGGGFYCGTGGCGAGVGTSPVIVQGFVDGGIILKVGS